MVADSLRKPFLVAAVVTFRTEPLVRAEPVKAIAHARLAAEVGQERSCANDLASTIQG